MRQIVGLSIERGGAYIAIAPPQERRRGSDRQNRRPSAGTLAIVRAAPPKRSNIQARSEKGPAQVTSRALPMHTA